MFLIVFYIVLLLMVHCHFFCVLSAMFCFDIQLNGNTKPSWALGNRWAGIARPFRYISCSEFLDFDV